MWLASAAEPRSETVESIEIAQLLEDVDVPDLALVPTVQGYLNETLGCGKAAASVPNMYGSGEEMPGLEPEAGFSTHEDDDDVSELDVSLGGSGDFSMADDDADALEAQLGAEIAADDADALAAAGGDGGKVGRRFSMVDAEDELSTGAYSQ